ncbi:MAG: FAD/NAD(P)-binding oxidoreductase [Acidimicrobiia bacterium]
MKRLVVLGSGTAGTTVVNKLRPRLDPLSWEIVVVDGATEHHYQPGYLFVPFGRYDPSDIVKPIEKYHPKGVEFRRASVETVDPGRNVVILEGGDELEYDYLVIATGTTARPDQTPGMLGEEWRKSVFDFYTLDGATALAERLESWEGGRLVVHITEMPIKCPVAPLEFVFLADSYFKEKGMRDKVELVYVTPLDGAFTKPVAAGRLGGMLDDRQITMEPDFYIERVDNEAKALVSYDEREIPFDLLVTVPLNMGAEFIARSGMGDELNYVPVDKETFVSPKWPNVFAIGDAADLPTSKAGSAAHFAVEVFTENFMQLAKGEEMTHRFDGHTNCFVESGAGKAMLIDFNYDVQPLPGKYPYPVVGPMALLEETKINHLGKMGFKWLYWNALLPGRKLPVPTLMSMAGKDTNMDTEVKV